MAKKPKLTAKDWLEKIERAKKVKEDWRKTFRIPTGIDFWEGRQRPPGVPGDEWITVNMIYSVLQAELPTLYSADPYYYVKLKKSFSINPMDIALYEGKAKVRQSMLNYLKGELNLKPKARLSIFDAFFQFGIAKTCYYADVLENQDAGKPIMENDMPLLDDKGLALLEPDFIPTNESYKLSRIHPDDFLVDEDAGPLDENISWKAERIRVPLEDAKTDKRYKAAARRNLKAVEITEEAEKERQKRQKGMAIDSQDKGADADICIMWELYHIKKKQWMVLSEGCDDFLIDPSPVPKGIEGDPYTELRFTLRPDSWYPLPPVSQWLDSQMDYCDLRSKVKTHRKRFNRKYELDSTAFDDAQQVAAQLTGGEDGTVLIRNRPNVKGIDPISDAPLDQQIHMEFGYLRQDFMDLAIGPNQRGATAGVDSATEAGILEKRAQIREGDKIGLVNDFLVGIARKLDQIVQANITQDQAVKVTGVQGEFWELIRSMDYEDIEGEYEYSINAGQSTPQLPEIERAQYMAFLGLIAQNPQLALSKALLKKMGEMHHITDEVMVEEIYNIAVQMMGGQLPMPGKQGSMANVSEMNPMAAMGGMAAGVNNIRGGQQ